MRHQLPRNIPELVAHAIGFEREAASRFHEHAGYLRQLGHHGLALPLVGRKRYIALNRSE